MAVVEIRTFRLRFLEKEVFKLKKRRIGYFRITCVALLLMAMIWGCDSLRRVSLKNDSDAALEKCIKTGNGDDKAASGEQPDQKSQKEAETEKTAEKYDTITKNSSDVSTGSLILINKEHGFVFSGNNDDLVKMADNTNRDHYKLAYLTHVIDTEALSAFNKMMEDFHGIHESNDVTVLEAFRSYDAQNEVYAPSQTEDGVMVNENALPAGSTEHHSGYALDLILVDNSGKITKFDGTGDYEWFKKNCFRYGFVLRYPEHKEEITKMAFQPGHFRYVGVPHSNIMNENDLSLEEYISDLKKHEFSGEHLTYSLNGNDYEIYYVKSSGDGTAVPVPSDPDTKVVISGNNDDGFIVTLKRKSESEEKAVTATPKKNIEPDKDVSTAQTDGE